jgi:LPS-assembly protein
MTADTTTPVNRSARLPYLVAAIIGFALHQPLAAQDTNSPQQSEPLDLDWVTGACVQADEITPECITCNGTYVDPLLQLDLSVPPEESDLKARATRTIMEGNIIRLEGGVEVSQGYRRLSGDSAILDRVEQSGELSGNIELREPGLLLRGEKAELFSKTGEAQIQGSAWVLHQQHLRGNARRLRRDEAGILHIKDGNLSYCPPGDNDWAIRSDDMQLDIEEGVGIARGAKLDVGGFPIFYWPWLQFPLDDRRRTGFLWPDIGSDTRGGLDVALPVYINIAPNYDALYIPRYIEERGLNHEMELRHLNRYLGAWSLGGAYLDDDKRYEDEYPEDRNPDRWLLMVRHNALFNQRWRSLVDYNKASDANYIKDLGTSSLNSKRKTSLLQLGSVDYLGEKWLVNFDVQQFQPLADDLTPDYKKLPQITGQWRATGTPFKFDPILLAQYSNFDIDSDQVTGERLYAVGGVAYPMLWNYGFFNSELKYRHVQYELDESDIYTDNTPSSGTPVVKLDGGLFFDRDTSLAGESLLQTLEPRLYYLYSEYEDQRDQPAFDSAELTFTYNQLFRDTRFSGNDRLDDANQLSLGVTTRYINNEDGREQFSASLGQIFYFDDRKVRLNPLDEPLDSSGSELAAEASFIPNERLSFRASLIWDAYSGKMNSGNFEGNYIWGNGNIFNLGYTYRRPLTLVTEQPPTEQAHVSTYFPVHKNWRLFAALNYSIEANTSVEDMIGVEYDSCCWNVRLLHLRYYDTVPGQVPDFNNPELQREDSTQFQITLKGMGGFGSRVTSILEDMIRGFREREY